MFFLTPAMAGKESAMSKETEATATPLAPSGGMSRDEAKALFTELLSPVAESLKSLNEGHTKLADGLKHVQESAGKAASSEAVAKLVTDQLTKHQADQAASSAASQKKIDARNKAIETHLKGVPASLVNLPDTDDENVLKEAASTLRKTIEGLPGVKLADIGGAGNDGGTPPGTATKAAEQASARYTEKNTGLSEGACNYRNSLDKQITALNTRAA
jgi:predicted component of type VI protein secretion system